MEIKRRAWKAGVLGVCACFAAAIGAGELDFNLFRPAGLGLIANPFVAGRCTVSYDSDTDSSSIHLVMFNLRPNTTYGFLLDGDGSGISDPIGIMTDCYGHAVYDRVIPQDATPDNTCKVYIWDGNLDTIYDVSNSEVRAVDVALFVVHK